MGSSGEGRATVGLVVLNYNNSGETIHFLEGLAPNDALDAIQVVDNCSTDGSGERLREYCATSGDERLAFVQSPTNAGYGRGNNLGARAMLVAIPCDYLVISNPDVVFDAGTIRAMSGFLDDNPQAAAVAPVMTKPSGEVCQSGWRLPTKRLFLADARRYFLPILGDPYDYGVDLAAQNEPFRVEVLPGSLFMMRASCFEAVDGFDEDTFLYGEENLLFAKIRNLGMGCFVLPQVRYVHAHGTSIEKEFTSLKKRYRMLLDANVIYARKVLGASKGWTRAYTALYTAAIDVFAVELRVRNMVGRYRGEGR